MVRGAAKAKAQEANAKKQQAAKKSGSQLGLGAKALSLDCAICKTRMPTLQNLKDHMESKHSASPLPDGLEEGLRAQAEKRAMDQKLKDKKAPPSAAPKKKKKKKKKKGGDADLSLLMEGLGTGKKKR